MYADRDCFTSGWAVGPCRDVLEEYCTPCATWRWAKPQKPELKLRMVHTKLSGCGLKRHTLNRQKLDPSSLTKGQIKEEASPAGNFYKWIFITYRPRGQSGAGFDLLR